jgi:hypothetical protein
LLRWRLWRGLGLGRVLAAVALFDAVGFCFFVPDTGLWRMGLDP